jgi:hypothetical protein
MNDPDTEELQRRLIELREAHRDLDDAIAALTGSPGQSQLQLQRLKRQKLSLKDQILKVENALIPDIIA